MHDTWIVHFGEISRSCPLMHNNKKTACKHRLFQQNSMHKKTSPTSLDTTKFCGYSAMPSNSLAYLNLFVNHPWSLVLFLWDWHCSLVLFILIYVWYFFQGKGSTKDKDGAAEESLAADPGFAHLNEDFHVLCEYDGQPQGRNQVNHYRTYLNRISHFTTQKQFWDA